MKSVQSNKQSNSAIQKSQNTYFISFMQQQIALLYEANRLGTARNYTRALHSFSAFLQGKDVPIKQVNEVLIEQYNAYLMRRGVIRNSISFYMRILRAVYNKAVRRRLVNDKHPFQEVYTGVDKTRKRAIAESVIVQLYRLDLHDSPCLSLARDLFIFSYCMRGMAFVDMVYLRTTDIQGNMLYYTRRKTGQLLSVRLEKNSWEIIRKYQSKTSKYVFPLLKSETPREAYSEYQLALNRYNRGLKQLSLLLKVPYSLTSYTSRHSWATAARNHNIPLSIISAGLGHTSEQTTQIYLASLENSVLDEANHLIIAGLDD